MANKKRTRSIEVRELESTIAINGDDVLYNINAVHSDSADSATLAAQAEEAAKVAHKLTIKSHNKADVSFIEFNGEEAKAIDIVPASGGSFQGPITVPDPADTTKIDNSTVVNYKIIKSIVELLTGSPLFSWNGSELTAQTLADGTTLQKVSIITGDYDDLTALVESATCPSVFLYICTDGYNKIILKTPDGRLMDLANSAAYLAGSTQDSSYTGDSLTAALNTIGGRLTATEQGITTNAKNISANSTSINNIKNGTIVVGKAAHAVSADSATKATQDSDGKQINLNYYRSTLKSDRVNSITISTNAPSGGNDGDIWIKY